MFLTGLSLSYIRTYNKQSIPVSPYTTVFLGPNAIGKTNIIEAIYALATGKSFRGKQDREMIAWGSEVGRITGMVEDTKLELVITPGLVQGAKAPLKKYLVNGIPRRMIDFIGHVRAVLFWPEHLELVTDSPSVRRNYIDSVLVQVDREYRRTLNSYEKGIRQRNKLLFLIHEGLATRGQLLFWNQLLVKAGSYLTDARAAYIEYVNAFVLPELHYRLVYDKSVISDLRLEQYADEEIAAKVTLVGPHRDDIIFHIKKTEYVDLSKYGSRGEQRMAILWLKLAELSFMQEKTGERPLLLLDDIFSELDPEHQRLVLDVIGKQQTVITAASIDIAALLKENTTGTVDIIHLPFEAV